MHAAAPQHSLPQHSPLHALGCCLRRRWTRVLLLQQLLVEVFDLLDPDL